MPREESKDQIRPDSNERIEQERNSRGTSKQHQNGPSKIVPQTDVSEVLQLPVNAREERKRSRSQVDIEQRKRAENPVKFVNLTGTGKKNKKNSEDSTAILRGHKNNVKFAGVGLDVSVRRHVDLNETTIKAGILCRFKDLIRKRGPLSDKILEVIDIPKTKPYRTLEEITSKDLRVCKDYIENQAKYDPSGEYMVLCDILFR